MKIVDDITNHSFASIKAGEISIMTTFLDQIWFCLQHSDTTPFTHPLHTNTNANSIAHKIKSLQMHIRSANWILLSHTTLNTNLQVAPRLLLIVLSKSSGKGKEYVGSQNYGTCTLTDSLFLVAVINFLICSCHQFLSGQLLLQLVSYQ